MSTNKFKDLVSRTREMVASRTTKLLIKTIKTQDDINKQLVNIKKDYSRNRKTYKMLYDEVSLLKSKAKKSKYDKLKNPLERRKGSGGGGGLLGALFGGLAAAKMFIIPLISKVISSVISKAGGIGKALLNLVKHTSKSGIRSGVRAIARTASALKNSGAARAAGTLGGNALRASLAAGAQVGRAVTSKVAIRQVATFIGRGIATTAAGAAAMPLLIASAAAAVGYGSYKLGRYLKLSEKLDDFIKKVSGGKFQDIGDFILGMVNGTVGKELFVWVKDKIDGLFTNAITFLKDKTNDILGKWSPFIDDPTTQAGGADDPNTSKDEGDKEEQKTKSNDDFRAQMASGKSSPSMLFDMQAGAKQATESSTPLMMQGVAGYNQNVSSSTSGETGGLAWKAITKGRNTQLNSRFGKRKGSKKVSSDHTGLDIQADMGTPIYAPEGGTVSRGSSEGGGIEAYLRGNSGTKYGFAHLSKVTASGKVSAGTEIARSGNSGAGTTGPHIHLSIRAPGSDKKINPEGYMIPGGGAKSPSSGGVGDTEHSVSSGIGHNVEYAKGYSSLSNSTSSSNNTNQQSTKQKSQPKSRKSIQQTQPASSSKSGSISGQVGTVKDPRGALSSDILMASMSPLFV